MSVYTTGSGGAMGKKSVPFAQANEQRGCSQIEALFHPRTRTVLTITRMVLTPEWISC